MKTLLRAAVACGLLLGATGCMKRTIVDVSEHHAGAMTLIETHDIVAPFRVGQNVLWECSDTATGLSCERTCGVKNNQGEMVKCLRIFKLGGSINR